MATWRLSKTPNLSVNSLPVGSPAGLGESGAQPRKTDYVALSTRLAGMRRALKALFCGL